MTDELLSDWVVFHKIDLDLADKLFSRKQQDYFILLDHVFEIFMKTPPSPTDTIH